MVLPPFLKGGNIQGVKSDSNGSSGAQMDIPAVYENVDLLSMGLIKVDT